MQRSNVSIIDTLGPIARLSLIYICSVWDQQAFRKITLCFNTKKKAIFFAVPILWLNLYLSISLHMYVFLSIYVYLFLFIYLSIFLCIFLSVCIGLYLYFVSFWRWNLREQHLGWFFSGQEWAGRESLSVPADLTTRGPSLLLKVDDFITLQEIFRPVE